MNTGELVTDIGTVLDGEAAVSYTHLDVYKRQDHAYLPIWLLKSGTCPQAIATDLREGPILQATHNAFRYRVQNRLVLRQCDGLAAVRPEEADDIAITGMGGELIAAILERAPWVCDEQKRLILQPIDVYKRQDLEAAERLNIPVMLAQSLPGKVAPQTAGIIIKQAIYSMLHGE